MVGVRRKVKCSRRLIQSKANETFVHSRRVFIEGHWDRCGVGPNAWMKICSAWSGFHWNRCYFTRLYWSGGTSLPPGGSRTYKVAEILKDQPSWFRDCGAVDVMNVLYAPTTLDAACDFWLMPSVLEDGTLEVGVRSLSREIQASHQYSIL